MAFGGVATGSMNAQVAASPAGIRTNNGLISRISDYNNIVQTIFSRQDVNHFEKLKNNKLRFTYDWVVI